jgi:hypothetical protein
VVVEGVAYLVAEGQTLRVLQVPEVACPLAAVLLGHPWEVLQQVLQLAAWVAVEADELVVRLAQGLF